MPEFPCSHPVTVDLRIIGGTVELHAEPRDTVVVDVSPYDSTDASREAAADTRVELTGDTLLIAAPETSGWLLRRAPRLRVTARVPAGSDVRIRVATADVTCHGDWTQAKLNTASGDAYFERVAEDLTINTASGDVRAYRIGGRLTVKTASGDVSVAHVGGAADITGASGDVQIDSAGGDVNVKTASGDTLVRAARQGTVRVTTVSGDAWIGVVAGTGVWLDLTTLSGRANSDLHMSDTTDAPPTGHTLTVQVRTVSGDIDIRRVTTPAASTPDPDRPAPHPGVRPS